jgi:hypothetical protein
MDVMGRASLAVAVVVGLATTGFVVHVVDTQRGAVAQASSVNAVAPPPTAPDDVNTEDANVATNEADSETPAEAPNPWDQTTKDDTGNLVDSIDGQLVSVTWYLPDENCTSLPHYFLMIGQPVGGDANPDPAMAVRVLLVGTGETFRVQQKGVVAELIDMGGPAGPAVAKPTYLIQGLDNCVTFTQEGRGGFKQPTAASTPSTSDPPDGSAPRP